MEKNKPSREKQSVEQQIEQQVELQIEQTTRVKGLLSTNKAAALGLAVLFATGTILSGCGGSPANQPGTAGWESVEEEDDEENQSGGNTSYYYGGYGGGGYFRYSGLPMFGPGGKVNWSKPSDTFKSGGYGFIRGGSAAG